MPRRILRPRIFTEDTFGFTDELLREEFGDDCEIIDIDELPRGDRLAEMVRNRGIDVIITVANSSRLAQELQVTVFGPLLSSRMV